MVDPLFYNTTLCQTLSPCGNFLLAGNKYGDIAVFDLRKIFCQNDSGTCIRNVHYIFHSNNKTQICSMASTDKFLIIGSVGEIEGYDWQSLTSTNHPKADWTIQLPSSKNPLENPDVNSLIFNKGEDQIYAGCGDNIYVFSLEDGKLIRTLQGHEDYIHSIDSLGNQMVSGGEDGIVRLWDLRQKSCTNKLKPHIVDKLARSNVGKWIGAVSLNEDWLLCGGGPKLSLWNLRSLEMTTVLPLDDRGVHVAMFYDDHLMAGGSCPFFYHLSYNGDVIAQIKTSAMCVLSVVHQETPHKLLSLAGASSKIDLCTNYNYTDIVLDFNTK